MKPKSPSVQGSLVRRAVVHQATALVSDDTPQRLRESEVREMQAAIDEGRCWELYDTEALIFSFMIGSEAEARDLAEQKEMEGYFMVPSGYIAAFVRRSTDVEALRPIKAISVHGAKWPAAERRGGICVEHPRWGWIHVGWREELARFLKRVAELPVAIGRYEGKRDYEIDFCLCEPDCVCTTAWDAVSLEDGTAVPWRITEGVVPRHVERLNGCWTLWSDGVITETSHIADECQSLEPDAVRLINLTRMYHDSAKKILAPTCGWATLARVAEIVSSEELARGTIDLGNPYEAIHRFDVWMVDGKRTSLWARSWAPINPNTIVYDFHEALPEEWRRNAEGSLLPIGR